MFSKNTAHQLGTNKSFAWGISCSFLCKTSKQWIIVLKGCPHAMDITKPYFLNPLKPALRLENKLERELPMRIYIDSYYMRNRRFVLIEFKLRLRSQAEKIVFANKAIKFLLLAKFRLNSQYFCNVLFNLKRVIHDQKLTAVNWIALIADTNTKRFNKGIAHEQNNKISKNGSEICQIRLPLKDK